MALEIAQDGARPQVRCVLLISGSALTYTQLKSKLRGILFLLRLPVLFFFLFFFSLFFFFLFVFSCKSSSSTIIVVAFSRISRVGDLKTENWHFSKLKDITDIKVKLCPISTYVTNRNVTHCPNSTDITDRKLTLCPNTTDITDRKLTLYPNTTVITDRKLTLYPNSRDIYVPLSNGRW